jgi:UDP-2,3-diacylglucosamine pyrophosphatase LpxH
LGTKDSQAEKLNNFLKHNSCDTLYLVGDIIDAWRIQQNKWRWKQSHTNVVRRVLGHAKRGTRVVYIAGNHDEFLRPMIPYGFSFGLIEIHNQIEHIGADGKHYLVVHGDMFDGITRLAPWIAFLGDKGYDVILSFNSKFNWIRHRFGFGYFSLSQYLKTKVKKAVDFIFHFEKNLAIYCKKRGYDGVICGHIHHAEIKDIDVFYTLTHGGTDVYNFGSDIWKNMRTIKHCVFGVSNPEGDVYCVISDQLNRKYGSNIPVIPHMVCIGQTTEDFAKNMDLSIAGGLGYHFKMGLGIGARYTAGISKVGDFDASQGQNPDFKNSNIQISLFYTLFNNRKGK